MLHGEMLGDALVCETDVEFFLKQNAVAPAQVMVLEKGLAGLGRVGFEEFRRGFGKPQGPP